MVKIFLRLLRPKLVQFGGMWPASRDPPVGVPLKFTRKLTLRVAVEPTDHQAVVEWDCGFWSPVGTLGSCHQKLIVSELWYLWDSLWGSPVSLLALAWKLPTGICSMYLTAGKPPEGDALHWVCCMPAQQWEQAKAKPASSRKRSPLLLQGPSSTFYCQSLMSF